MAANVAHRRRFAALQEMGCLACLIDGHGYRPPDIHHVVDRGTRELSGGHDSTLALCEWHHRGIPFRGYQAVRMVERFGPSLDRHKVAFRERYGDERQLLVIQDSMFRMHEVERKRGAYMPPGEVMEVVQALHKEVVRGMLVHKAPKRRTA